jgi:hypothetical protein
MNDPYLNQAVQGDPSDIGTLIIDTFLNDFIDHGV